MKNVKVVVCEKSDGFVSYELVSLEKWSSGVSCQPGYSEKDGPNLGEHLLSHSFHMEALRKLMGKTLTILDASTTGAQNKAMKDLVRSSFSDAMEDAAKWSFDQQSLQALIPDDIDPNKIGTVSIEEALGVE